MSLLGFCYCIKQLYIPCIVLWKVENEWIQFRFLFPFLFLIFYGVPPNSKRSLYQVPILNKELEYSKFVEGLVGKIMLLPYVRYMDWWEGKMFDQFLGKLSHWNNIFKQLSIDGSKLVKTGNNSLCCLILFWRSLKEEKFSRYH